VHFFNPVPVMGLIELIRGLATSDATVATVEAYAARLGKQVVRANDAPGFIVNRVLMPMLNEACFALGEGVATIRDIDLACQLGLNHPMGPLTLADFIGLDTCLEITRVLFEGTGDPKFRPAPVLVKYVEAGWFGRKTGRGFYDYAGPEPVPTR
jgi:3-hydroxybutyryl-CoA dehydrogenase